MAGNYTCVAANDYGSDQRQFTLQILGKGASCEKKCCKSNRGNTNFVRVCLRNVLSSIFLFQLTDLPRQPTNVTIDPTTQQITWEEVAGYECLPESHFVVEYKKSQSKKNWTTAGYLKNRRFDLSNVSRGEIYDVRIYAVNVIGRSPPSKVATFRTNRKLRRISISQ